MNNDNSLLIRIMEVTDSLNLAELRQLEIRIAIRKLNIVGKKDENNNFTPRNI